MEILVCGQRFGGRTDGRELSIVHRPASALDVGLSPDFLQRQPALPPRAVAPAPTRLLRLALLLLLPCRAGGVLDHAPLLPVVPPPPDFCRRLRPCGLSAALHDRAPDDFGHIASGMAQAHVVVSV